MQKKAVLFDWENIVYDEGKTAHFSFLRSFLHSISAPRTHVVKRAYGNSSCMVESQALLKVLGAECFVPPYRNPPKEFVDMMIVRDARHLALDGYHICIISNDADLGVVTNRLGEMGIHVFHIPRIKSEELKAYAVESIGAARRSQLRVADTILHFREAFRSDRYTASLENHIEFDDVLEYLRSLDDKLIVHGDGDDAIVSLREPNRRG
eukprot:TRINITY_DN38989_c0_g1_i1.p1 TRINITY_DN38989_c0_g1~~TRINITY_DN38989_c0_g1_i1.p1  ORF type:complete len:209 (+),score=38.89 TRINITY_DN38989_c0_g1_i1:82-708(+)